MRYVVSWVVFFLLLGFPSFLLALPAGPFDITPELTFEERYDSNIFLTTDAQDDFITKGILNLKVALPINLTGGRRIIPNISYLAEAAAFIKNPDQNFQNQGISGGLDLDFPLAQPDQRFTINVSNRFRGGLVEVSSSAAQSDIGPRTRRNENSLTTDVGYFLTRRDEFHLTYNRLDVDQKDIDQFLDGNENTVGLTYFRQIGPLFSGLIESAYKFINFTHLSPTDPDFSSTGPIIAIGIRRDPEARLSGTFKVGAELRNFERQASVVRPYASAVLRYRITPRLLASLLFTQAMQASTNQDYAFYEATIVRLRFTQQFTPKLSASVEGGFEQDQFQDRVNPADPQLRSDRLYGLVVGGEYLFARWLTGGLSYLYQTKNSNVVQDYVDQRVTLRITLSF